MDLAVLTAMVEGQPERGGAFYDDKRLLDHYLAHRHAPVASPNLVMEDPAFMREAGDLRGLRVVDLGCGDGTFGRTCLVAACESYLGIDGSAAMIDRADAMKLDDRARFQTGDIEDVAVQAASVDLLVSRMALHYVADLAPVFARAHACLAAGGRLIFTVVHPVVTSSITASTGERTSVVVDDYFRPGEREREWFGSPVTWQHRSIEAYVDAVADAGFSLSAIRECAPVEHLFAGDDVEFDRRQRAPLFLLVSARA